MIKGKSGYYPYSEEKIILPNYPELPFKDRIDLTLREDGMIPEGETMDEFLVRKLATADNLYLKEK